MIRVDRAPIPKVLIKNAARWLAEFDGATRRSDRERLLKRYRHREIKSALVSMFRGKCAYCESQILHIDYGDIEHYRPKAGPCGRPDLVFDWDNLLLACGVCNGAQYKRDRFPEADEGGPILNPCEDEPRDHLEFHFDRVARVASVYGKTNRGLTTEKLLGLNRRDLRRVRSEYLWKLLVIAMKSSSDPDAAAILEETCRPDAQYSAFAIALRAAFLAQEEGDDDAH